MMKDLICELGIKRQLNYETPCASNYHERYALSSIYILSR